MITTQPNLALPPEWNWSRAKVVRHARERLATADPARRPLDRADRRPPLAADEEAELARRALAGDLAARNELVEQYIPLIRKIAKNKHASSDAFLTALLSLVLAAERYNPDRSYGKYGKIRFGTYAGRHVHWRLAKWAAAEWRKPGPASPGQVVQRDRWGRGRTLDDLAAHDAADRAAEAADRAEAAARRAEAAARLAEAVTRLTPGQRHVAERMTEPGRHAADIAAELGLTEIQVYGYWRRAKDALRRDLDRGRYDVAA